ncbi:hypothetical protein P2H44_22805 [Albimonas sp. CAU 1670]|uniref:helix-turn-helix transcriptional regulator n=1 Tax=Albimonas sp. CAU 1670 TaxID=3032599 RepID=UPI0023DB83CC|nr:hypothetical protein [Albimonas sp. CAU 1670]MDF2235396.1 hypothetical protein [Albimonas sp. CAU 1670]
MRTPPGPSLSNPAVQPPRVFVRSAEVADLLGYASAQSFRGARRRLEDEEDFPPPARMAGREYLWRTGEVLAWMDRPPASVAGVPDLSPEDLAVDRAILMRRAAQA